MEIGMLLLGTALGFGIASTVYLPRLWKEESQSSANLSRAERAEAELRQL